MKKIKTLALAALPIATVGATAGMITTSCSKTSKILTYDEAKEWVKNNYGEESKDYTLAKTESSWGFTGWINYFASAADVAKNTGWLYNHLDNLLIGLSNETSANVKKSEYDRTGATDATGSHKGKCALGDIAFGSELLKDDGPIVVESEQTLKTLSGDSFDNDIEYWFKGAFRYSAEYIVNGKNLTLHGTLSFVQKDGESQNVNNLKMPDCYITYDSKGRLAEVKFDFQKMTLCSFSYQTSEQTPSSWGYSFILNAGSYINAKYSFAE